jgi:pantothenate kinase
MENSYNNCDNPEKEIKFSLNSLNEDYLSYANEFKSEEDILEKIKIIKNKKIFKKYSENNFKYREHVIIGLSGIPGSGKSTFSQHLKEKLNSLFKDKDLRNNQDEVCMIIQFDGFHKYKKDLFDDQMEYRGRIDTFDLEKFRLKLEELKIFTKLKNSSNKNPNNENSYNDKINFPSFDHSKGDPIENDISISKNTQFIIIEGLYLFVKDLDCINNFDLSIFLKTEINESMERVSLRNFKAGISKTYEESIIRTNKNDKANALYVLSNLQVPVNKENLFTYKYL